MSSWMLREKNSEVLTEIRIPGWTGRETFVSALTSQTLCTPRSWWRRPAMWWRQEVRSTCHPLALSIFLKHHWRLARQDHKEKYVCLSVSDLWCGLRTCLCGCMHVCRPEDNSEYCLYSLFSDRVSYCVHSAAMMASQWASGICLSPVTLWYGHRHTLPYMPF